MKHIILSYFATLLLLVSFQAEAKKIEGTVFYEHDTVKMTLAIPMALSEVRFHALEKNIYYFKENGDKALLNISEVKSIKFRFNGELLVFKAVPQHWKYILPSTNFVRVESSSLGPIQVYSYHVKEAYRTTTAPLMMPNGSFEMGMSFTVQEQVIHYLIIKNGVITELPDRKFQRFIREYFEDCPKLIEKVKSKQLGREYLGAIVNYYNSSCQ